MARELVSEILICPDIIHIVVAKFTSKDNDGLYL